MARAITTTERNFFRECGQASKLYLAISKHPMVFTAQVNQTFSIYDGIGQVIYDNGAGTLANILPGMTLWVGTSAGAHDKGMTRIRKAPSVNTFYIGETADIAWADNDYLTVVDDFGLWEKHPTIAGTNEYEDYDIPYTNQHQYPDPVVRMGPIAEVLKLTGATINSARTCETSTILGEAITGYLWSAPGASATAALTTTAPTITYNAAGEYRVACTFTVASGKTWTEYRKTFVFDAAHPPVTAFELKDLGGSLDDGGWNFSVTLYDEADLSTIMDRALVVLFSEDFYRNSSGPVKQSIGPIQGFENIIAWGWIGEETIDQDPEAGSIDFGIKGPAWWLDQMPGFTVGIENSTGTPNAWTQIQNLTVDKGLWHMLHWRSTASAILDITLTGDTKIAPSLEGAAGSLLSQMRAFTMDTIAADVICDRYGRVFAQVDSQYLAMADRNSIPLITTIEKQDWCGKIDYERKTVPECGQLEISGISYDGTTAAAIFSQASGKVFGRYGKYEPIDNLLFSSQAQANALCAAILARLNNEWPTITISLAANNRMIDMAPLQYVQLSVAAADTIRGFTWTKKLIARSIRYQQDPESKALLPTIDFEAETIPGLSITIIPPKTPNYNIPSQPSVIGMDLPPISPIGDLPGLDIPDWTPPDAGLPGLVCRTNDGYAANGPFKLWTGIWPIESGFSTQGMLESWVRKSTATYKTQVVIDGYWEIGDTVSGPWTLQTDDAIPCTIKATASGVDLLAATYSWDLKPSENGGHGILRATFEPASGFNASYYVVNMQNSGQFYNGVTIEHTSYIKNWGISEWLMFGRIGHHWHYYSGGYQTVREAIYRIKFNQDLNLGVLYFSELMTEVQYPGGGAFPSKHGFDPSGNPETDTPISPDTTYIPQLPNNPSYPHGWYTGGGQIDFHSSNPQIRSPQSHVEINVPMATIFAPDIRYFKVYSNNAGLGSLCNSNNGLVWELTGLVFRPNGHDSGDADITLFGSAFRRVTINSMNVYNVCARE